jgi:glucose-6-phosphate dehydrogenase assembly protein OpcA
LADIRPNESGYVGGHLVRRRADGSFQVEAPGGFKAGTLDSVNDHIQESWQKQTGERKAVDKALARAADVESIQSLQAEVLVKPWSRTGFRLTGRVTGRFRNTVFSHLNSDLPLVFWWQGELSEVFTERLSSVIDRLIVDSSSWADPKVGFARISEATEGNTALVVQDLAWTRCWQFRVGIAGLFDDAVAQAMLGEIANIRIKHSPPHRNTALQLLAWLAVQAGWKIAGANTFETKEGRRIVADIESSADSATLGLIELSSPKTTVRISREKGTAHLLREIESGDYKVSSLSPADPDSSESLIACQLSRGGKNSLFLKILPTFLVLL